MHFSIPETQEVSHNSNSSSSSFTVFNIHVNGVYHCSVRYRQLHSFHEQLKKEFGAAILPPFPPKKLLSLTSQQLEERRAMLERYIQLISQNPQISASDIFNQFLLHAQQESQKAEPVETTLDVYLMNGHKITVFILSTDQTDDVLEVVASQVQLADDYVYYFGLFLVKKDEDGDMTIVRRLQEFESPYISLSAAEASTVHRICLRKGYWDSSYDDDLIEDRIAMNLLYVQAVSDVERGWVKASKEQLKQLESLKQRGSKKEFLRLARTLRYYGFIQFKPCTVDYPVSGSRCMVCAGNKELSIRIEDEQRLVKEMSFRVTRMRCWRITTTVPDELDGEPSEVDSGQPHLELAFEYLIARDTLKWITVASEQAILISMCLQAMVDELMMKKQGKRIKKPQDRNKKERNVNVIKRDVSSSSIKSPSSPTTEEKVAAFSTKSPSSKSPQHGTITENDAFEGIGDDDL